MGEGAGVRLAPEGIPVFEIRPGVIRTHMSAKVAANYDAHIAALTSRQFAYATGTVINVDGGLLIPRL